MNNTTSEDNNLLGNLTIPESYKNKYSASKQCSGKGCTKIAKNLLTILYINKKGYFCDDCTSDLLTKQLAMTIQKVSITD